MRCLHGKKTMNTKQPLKYSTQSFVDKGAGFSHHRTKIEQQLRTLHGSQKAHSKMVSEEIKGNTDRTQQTYYLFSTWRETQVLCPSMLIFNDYSIKE